MSDPWITGEEIDALMRRATPIPRDSSGRQIMGRRALERQVRILEEELAAERSKRGPAPDPTAPPSAPSPAGPPVAADVLRMDQAVPSTLQWLWPGRVPLGKLTVLAGDPGLGKSFLTLDMAARVSTGTAWPDARDQPQEAGGVVLLSAEDDVADTILPRLRAAGAELGRVAVLRGIRWRGRPTEPLSLDTDLPILESAVRDLGGVRLVVVDPISAYAGRTDTHNNAEVRALLAPLADLATRCGLAVVLVTHLNKAAGAGTKGMYRISGSLALPAAARSAMLVVRDRDDPARRLLIGTKLNVGRMPTGLAYSITDGRKGGATVAWEDRPVTLTADEAVSADESQPDQPGAIDEACEFLRQALADGPKGAGELIKQAEELGIHAQSLRRAKHRLGVSTARVAQGWVWSPREGDKMTRQQDAGG